MIPHKRRPGAYRGQGHIEDRGMPWGIVWPLNTHLGVCELLNKLLLALHCIAPSLAHGQRHEPPNQLEGEVARREQYQHLGAGVSLRAREEAAGYVRLCIGCSVSAQARRFNGSSTEIPFISAPAVSSYKS